MISTDANPSNGAARFFGALLASVAINAFAWYAISMMITHLPHAEHAEELAIHTTRIRMERRPPPTPTPKPTPKPKAKPAAPRLRTHGATPAGPVQPPVEAVIALPKNFQTTYLGSARVNDRDIKMWLDWSNQSAEFVPRVYLWHRAIDALDPREVSLHDEVQTILAQLKDEGDIKFYANHAARACNGRYPAWYLSYDKDDADPHVHIDDMLLIANGQVYRATYVRTLDEKEDAAARAALTSMC